MIAYFHGNIYAKNCQNRFMYIQVIASYVCELFSEHSVVTVSKLHLLKTVQFLVHLVYIITSYITSVTQTVITILSHMAEHHTGNLDSFCNKQTTLGGNISRKCQNNNEHEKCANKTNANIRAYFVLVSRRCDL